MGAVCGKDMGQFGAELIHAVLEQAQAFYYWPNGKLA